MEYGGVGFLRRGIHFVHGNEKRLAGGAQEPGQLFVEGRKAGLAIDYQNEQRGFLDGYMRLAQDFLGNQSLVVRHDTACIDYFQRPAAPFGPAVDAIAGNTRLIGDNGATRASQTVEERGLAHVGATDDNERWEQIGHRFLSSALYGCCRASSNLPM